MVDHTPMAGFSSGPDGVKVLMHLLRTGMPDMYAVIHDQVAEGNKVVTRKSFRGTHQGELFGVPATGRPLSIEVIDIIRVENGQIAEHWNVVDQLGLMQQMGVIAAG
jgi:predicted ester cyclase